MNLEKDEKITWIDESYTCVQCARKNLKLTEIAYEEDSEGQIIESSVLCLSCFLKSPNFLTFVKRDAEAYRTVDKMEIKWTASITEE